MSALSLIDLRSQRHELSLEGSRIVVYDGFNLSGQEVFVGSSKRAAVDKVLDSGVFVKIPVTRKTAQRALHRLLK